MLIPAASMRFQSRFLNKASHGKFWSSWSHPVKSGRLDPLCYLRSIWRSQDWCQSWLQRVDWKWTGSWCLNFWRDFIAFFFPEQWFQQPLLLCGCWGPAASLALPLEGGKIWHLLSLWGLDKSSGMKRMENPLMHAHTCAHTLRKKDECLYLSGPCKRDNFYLVFTYGLALQGWLSVVLF